MGRNIRLTVDLSTETLQAKKGWHDIFRILNNKIMQLRILYPARLSFRIEGEIKSFQDRQKLKECDHQTSSARNIKGDSVKKKKKKRMPKK